MHEAEKEGAVTIPKFQCVREIQLGNFVDMWLLWGHKTKSEQQFSLPHGSGSMR